jgi:hypothetical protein
LDIAGVFGDGQGDDRFVQLNDKGGWRILQPPLRIDRRTPLQATYLPFSHQFVVSTAHWPEDVRPAAERRWAKTNCLAVWLVAVETGAVRRECIPFGDYAGELPQPVPTADALFFTVAGKGFYKVESDGSVRLIAATSGGTAVSPDGCRIGFAATGRGAETPSIHILDACPAIRNSSG